MIEIKQSTELSKQALRELSWLSWQRLNNDQHFGVAFLDRPYLNQPPGSVPFFERGAVAVPSNLATATVLQFTVPDGYMGVAYRMAAAWTDGSVVDGSGVISFNLYLDGKPVRNFVNVTQRIGNTNDPQEIGPIMLQGNDVVTVTGTRNGSITGSLIGSMVGFYYPQRYA